MLDQLVFPVGAEHVRTSRDGMVGLHRGDMSDRLGGQIKPRRIVDTQHAVGCRRRALLFISVDRESGSTDVTLARKQERGDFLGIAVEVDQDGPVGREECVEGVLCERVRVLSVFTENHEVDDVDDTHSYALGTKNGGCSDNFVRDFYADTNENDVGLEAVVRRVLAPDRCAGDAVSLRLFNIQPDLGWVFGADDQVDEVFRSKAVCHDARRRVGVRGEVDTCAVLEGRCERPQAKKQGYLTFGSAIKEPIRAGFWWEYPLCSCLHNVDVSM